MFSEIMKYMKEYKGASVGEISAVLGIDRDAAEMALSELESMGRLKKVKIEKYSCGGKCGICSCTENDDNIFVYATERRGSEETVN